MSVSYTRSTISDIVRQIKQFDTQKIKIKRSEKGKDTVKMYGEEMETPAAYHYFEEIDGRRLKNKIDSLDEYEAEIDLSGEITIEIEGVEE